MPKTAQKIFDKFLRRDIHIDRFTNKLANDSLRLLRKAERDIIARLETGQLTEFGRKRFENMLISIAKINDDIYDEIEKNITKELRQFTKDEMRFNTKAIQQSYDIKLVLNRPATSQVFAAVISRPMQGTVLKQWVKNAASASIKKIDAAVQLGFVEGETIGQIVSRLKDVNGISKRGMEAIVRTAVTHTSSVARENLYEANKDILKGVRWVSTLDGNTTPICQRRDGKEYKIGEGPRPPAHFACRSSTVPVTKSWKELGFDDLDEGDNLSKRPFVVDKRKVQDIPKSERNIGVTVGNETYPKWLKRQPAGFQDDVLGKTKGKLFRNNTLTIDKFSAPRGRVYTLEELRQRENLTLEEITPPKPK